MADIIDVNIGDSTLEVFWQDEVELNLDMALMYIKSGEAEIQDYVDNVSKPEISNYVETEAKPLVSQIVEEIAEPTVAEYIETTVKPEIDEYVEDKKPELQAYVTQASGYADDSQASAEASAASAAASLTSANNASQSATSAQSSANSATSSKNAAASSATSASNYANNSKIWAEGTDAQVQALGGSKSAKGWAEASTNLDYTNITNCITKIPQDIKLEFNNGTLTLKAGSKVYVPNGSGVFDEVIIQSDISRSSVGYGSGKFQIYYTKSTNDLNFAFYNNTTSGTSTPVNGLFYNTATNSIDYYVNSSITISKYSFPLCTITAVSGSITSIDHVFNGFGYIGSHWYELKGNEGKARNGRNADGSLNNSTRTTTKVMVHPCGGGTGEWFLTSGFDGNFRNANQNSYFVQDEMPNADSYSGNYAVWESPRENIIRVTGDKGVTWTKTIMVNCGECSTVDGRITSFKPKTVFQAVDRNDTEWASTASKPSNRYVDLELKAFGTTYTAPANGWVSIKILFTGPTSYSNLQVTTSRGINFHLYGSGTIPLGCSFPISQGENFTISYGTNGTYRSDIFRLIYDEGSK